MVVSVGTTFSSWQRVELDLLEIWLWMIFRFHENASALVSNDCSENGNVGFLADFLMQLKQSAHHEQKVKGKSDCAPEL